MVPLVPVRDLLLRVELVRRVLLLPLAPEVVRGRRLRVAEALVVPQGSAAARLGLVVGVVDVVGPGQGGLHPVGRAAGTETRGRVLH